MKLHVTIKKILLLWVKYMILGLLICIQNRFFYACGVISLKINCTNFFYYINGVRVLLKNIKKYKEEKKIIAKIYVNGKTGKLRVKLGN